MITEVKISNFKSVQDLTLQLGRINVLIGANGSGKSNILEAIAFGGAASADKLDNEFLGSRGIRTANSSMMKSAFANGHTSKDITLSIKEENSIFQLSINELRVPIPKWVVIEREKSINLFMHILKTISNSEDKDSFFETDYFHNLSVNDKKRIDIFSEAIKKFVLKNDSTDINDKTKYTIDELENAMIHNPIMEIGLYKYNSSWANFIIYSPEITSLRKFEEEGQIQPLGIKGEGLFSALQIFYESYGKETIDELRKHLNIIEWFDDFEAIFDKVSGRNSLVVKDKHLPDVTLNQHNVNEGFLFLLFYISLIISKETPTFFAIDNIEASFHPRLCEELIKNIVTLAKKHDKQIILTTHNPFILDGLDLNDPEQKLFVVRRNADGETIADNIAKAPKKIKLSEAWMRGYIGGQPETIE